MKFLIHNKMENRKQKNDSSGGAESDSWHFKLVFSCPFKIAALENKSCEDYLPKKTVIYPILGNKNELRVLHI